MRAVSYQHILRAGVELSGQNFSTLQTEDAVKWRGWISLELRNAWEVERWPELMRAEKRFFRDLYAAATTYAAGDEVYYPPEKKHYQALRVSTGNAPTEESHWAELLESYDAADYDAATAYIAGEQVYYPVNDTFYQCHTASTGNAPTDTSFWGPLTQFNRYVATEQTGKTPLGEVFSAYDRNPRLFMNVTPYAFTLTADGVTIDTGITEVWLEYRVRAPRLFGDTFSASATYAVGDQIYFSGDFYDCVTATSAGESPTTTAVKWSIVDIPWIFESYLVQAAHARFMISDGQNEKAVMEQRAAIYELRHEADKLYRQQGQVRRTKVLAR